MKKTVVIDGDTYYHFSGRGDRMRDLEAEARQWRNSSITHEIREREACQELGVLKHYEKESQACIRELEDKVERLDHENLRLRHEVVPLRAEAEQLKQLACSEAPTPVVWVKQRGDSTDYRLCDEEGGEICSANLYLDKWKAIYDDLAEVRVWEESNADPKTDSSDPWIYVIWSDVPRCVAPVPTREQIEGLLNGATDNRNHLRGVPLFGVRRLTEEEKPVTELNEKYAAFRNGKRIMGTICLESKNCINEVLQRLTPAPAAVTLADLEVVEPDAG